MVSPNEEKKQGANKDRTPNAQPATIAEYIVRKETKGLLVDLKQIDSELVAVSSSPSEMVEVAKQYKPLIESAHVRVYTTLYRLAFLSPHRNKQTRDGTEVKGSLIQGMRMTGLGITVETVQHFYGQYRDDLYRLQAESGAVEANEEPRVKNYADCGEAILEILRAKHGSKYDTTFTSGAIPDIVEVEAQNDDDVDEEEKDEG